MLSGYCTLLWCHLFVCSFDIKPFLSVIKLKTERKLCREFLQHSAVWEVGMTRLLVEDGTGMEERWRVCLVARIRGWRQQRI